ncbi:MAG: apolipoprotein N-acyltransferase [Nitriliruptoraceae bacterium]
MTPRWAVAAPWLVAAASGFALFAASAPLGWWQASLVHAPVLIAAMWLGEHVDGSLTRGRAAALGAVAGAVAFGPMLSWLVAPAGPLAFGLLVGVQVAWYALLAAVVAPWRRHRALPVIAAVVWTGVDAWRSIFPLNGFEWGAIPYSHVDGSWLLPVARVLGGRGITLFAVAIGVAALVVGRAFWVITRHRDWSSTEGMLTAERSSVAQLAGALLLSAVVVTAPPPSTGTMDIIVAQGHDVEFWSSPVPNLALHVARGQRHQTLEAIGDGPLPDLVVWPENAIDRDPTTTRGQELADIIDEVAGHAGELITGTTLDGPDPSRNRYVAASRYVEGFGEVERYTKRRLVPFGEYVPLRRYLDWIPRLEQVPRDAIPGDGPQVMTTATGVPVAVVICFETLFAELVRTNVLAGDEPAQLILAITNDAAFRVTAEPDQHLAQSRLRAVETGRWVVHGALSGSSAFVDPDGVVHDATALFAADAIRRDVPLVSGLTPYLRVGDLLGLVTRGLVVVAAAIGVAGWSHERRAGTGRGRR